MASLIVNAPLTRGQIYVSHGGDWDDPIPQIMNGAEPLPLTNCDIELFVRPVLDHSTLIALVSVANGKIKITDAAEGLAEFDVRQADVESYPVGEWEFFLRLKIPDPGPAEWFIKELCRGPFIVLPGNDAP
jgi:hypothetical protein